TSGHARALLALASDGVRESLAKQAVTEGLSVRELERKVRDLLSGGPVATPKPVTAPGRATNDATVRSLEDELRRYLQTDVHIQVVSKGKGALRVSFYSAEDLDRLLDLILRDRRS